MKTLSTNFANKLKIRSDYKYSYIVKMVGSSNTYYFSNEYGTVTDSGTKQVLGLLASNPQIKETVDIKTGVSSVGGFSIQIIDNPTNRFSDNFASEFFYNREISLYLNIDGLAALSDCLLVYSGLFEDWEQDGDVITISVINSTNIFNTLYPIERVTESDFYGGGIVESLGKTKQLVYGSHPFKFGEDGSSTDLIGDSSNNMVKAIPLGWSRTDNTRRYLVAGHALKTTDSTHFRPWVIDKKSGRLVKLDSADYSFTTVGNDTILQIIDNPTVYDYFYPNKATGTSGGTGVTITTPDNAADGNSSTVGSIQLEPTIMTPGATIYYIDIDFNDAEPYSGYYDLLDEVKVFVITDFAIGTTAFYSFQVDGPAAGSDFYDLEAITTKTITNTHTYNTGYVGIIGNGMRFQVTYDSATGAPATANVYYVVKRAQYDIPEIGDVYVACEGLADDGSGTITGTPDALIEIPSDVIKSMILNHSLFASIDTTAFSASATILSSWENSFTIYESKRIKEMIESVSESAKSIFSINSNNEADIFTFNSSYTTTKDGITIDEIKNVSLSKTSIIDIISKLILRYKYNLIGNDYSLEVNRDNSTTESNINNEQVEEVETRYIQDDTTAGLLADHFCKNASVAFWGETHNVIEFDTVDFRGINFWDGSTFTPFINLEMFDILEFNLDDWRKINGESWSGKQFLIVELVRNINNLRIKAVEL